MEKARDDIVGLLWVNRWRGDTAVVDGARESKLIRIHTSHPLFSILFRFQQAALHGIDDGLGAIAEMQLFEDILEMILDGVFAQVNARGNFAVCESLRRQRQHFFFALAQRIFG